MGEHFPWTRVQVCTNGCQRNAAGPDDQCAAQAAACPSGNGLCCGDASG
jgi:hypothetical protein